MKICLRQKKGNTAVLYRFNMSEQKPIKAKPKKNESALQRSCIKWFRLQYPNYSSLLFAIPNGGYRSPIEAAIMKGEGVLAGVADLFFSFPSSGYHGFYIELKYEKGKQTPSQKDFQSAVTQVGYRYEVVNSLDDFMLSVNSYLKGIL